MHSSDKLIRLGVWLVPWLPVFLLAAWVYAAYFAPPVYVSTEKLVVHLDSSSSFVPVAPSAQQTAAFHVTPALVTLLCVVCAFLAGCALLLIGFFRRPKSSPNPRPST